MSPTTRGRGRNDCQQNDSAYGDSVLGRAVLIKHVDDGYPSGVWYRGSVVERKSVLTGPDKDVKVSHRIDFDHFKTKSMDLRKAEKRGELQWIGPVLRQNPINETSILQNYHVLIEWPLEGSGKQKSGWFEARISEKRRKRRSVKRARRERNILVHFVDDDCPRDDLPLLELIEEGQLQVMGPLLETSKDSGSIPRMEEDSSATPLPVGADWIRTMERWMQRMLPDDDAGQVAETISQVKNLAAGRGIEIARKDPRRPLARVPIFMRGSKIDLESDFVTLKTEAAVAFRMHKSDFCRASLLHTLGMLAKFEDERKGQVVETPPCLDQVVTKNRRPSTLTNRTRIKGESGASSNAPEETPEQHIVGHFTNKSGANHNLSDDDAMCISEPTLVPTQTLEPVGTSLDARRDFEMETLAIKEESIAQMEAASDKDETNAENQVEKEGAPENVEFNSCSLNLSVGNSTGVDVLSEHDPSIQSSSTSNNEKDWQPATTPQLESGGDGSIEEIEEMNLSPMSGSDNLAPDVSVGDSNSVSGRHGHDTSVQSPTTATNEEALQPTNPQFASLSRSYTLSPDMSVGNNNSGNASDEHDPSVQFPVPSTNEKASQPENSKLESEENYAMEEIEEVNLSPVSGSADLPPDTLVENKNGGNMLAEHDPIVPSTAVYSKKALQLAASPQLESGGNSSTKEMEEMNVSSKSRSDNLTPDMLGNENGGTGLPEQDPNIRSANPPRNEKITRPATSQLESGGNCLIAGIEEINPMSDNLPLEMLAENMNGVNELCDHIGMHRPTPPCHESIPQITASPQLNAEMVCTTKATGRVLPSARDDSHLEGASVTGRPPPHSFEMKSRLPFPTASDDTSHDTVPVNHVVSPTGSTDTESWSSECRQHL